MPSVLKERKPFEIDSNAKVCWNCENFKLGIPCKCSINKFAKEDICNDSCKDFKMFIK